MTIEVQTTPPSPLYAHIGIPHCILTLPCTMYIDNKSLCIKLYPPANMTTVVSDVIQITFTVLPRHKSGRQIRLAHQTNILSILSRRATD